MNFKAWFALLGICLCCGCSTLRQVDELPPDTYVLPGKVLVPKSDIMKRTPEKIKATLQLTDSALIIKPVLPGEPLLYLNLQEPQNLKFYRRTFDVDVLTIPFKIRPSVQSFPEQLNSNFSAALYLGRRFDYYHLKSKKKVKSNFISGFGGGYGGFLGLGAVTMNPFVTQNAINYEYDGFVLTGGAAGIYDAKKFNLGLAVGTDFLVDKNRRVWIYHRKPWFGLLFGINLN